MIYDVIIVGGGPAGLMAANILNQHHINYVLLEKNERVGKKILLTGGKRCNVTNNLSTSDFISRLHMKHKRFLFHALNQFGTNDVVTFFKNKGLNLELEHNLKYFPETHKSQSVVDALTKDLDKERIKCLSFVKKIEQSVSGFTVETKDEMYQCRYLLIATGSNAYPSVGSSGDGLVFANHLGIQTIPFTPAETYLYSNVIKEKFKEFQGISIKNCKVKLIGTSISYQDDLLFTHFGLSGPVILHLSELIYHALLEGHHVLSISFVEQTSEALLYIIMSEAQNKPYIMQIIEQFMPKKIAQNIILETIKGNKRVSEISKKHLNEIVHKITDFKVRIDGVETKEKAFVNAGGIKMTEIDAQSMSVKKVPNLFFAGEVNDLQGPIGGFNITIALSTGHLAARSMIDLIKTAKL